LRERRRVSISHSLGGEKKKTQQQRGEREVRERNSLRERGDSEANTTKEKIFSHFQSKSPNFLWGRIKGNQKTGLTRPERASVKEKNVRGSHDRARGRKPEFNPIGKERGENGRGPLEIPYFQGRGVSTPSEMKNPQQREEKKVPLLAKKRALLRKENSHLKKKKV